MSPSPGRILSKSPKDRSISPKIKRKMMSHIVKGPEKTVWLTIFDRW
jgi:hypothetical protein